MKQRINLEGAGEIQTGYSGGTFGEGHNPHLNPRRLDVSCRGFLFVHTQKYWLVNE